MAFNFRAELLRAWDHVVARYGVEMKFTPKTGTAITGVRVILTQSTQIQPSGDMQTWGLGNTIEYSLSDVPREARVGETFTITDAEHPEVTKVFTVKSLESNDGHTVKVVV
jgi:hypothetical protein